MQTKNGSFPDMEIIGLLALDYNNWTSTSLHFKLKCFLTSELSTSIMALLAHLTPMYI